MYVCRLFAQLPNGQTRDPSSRQRLLHPFSLRGSGCCGHPLVSQSIRYARVRVCVCTCVCVHHLSPPPFDQGQRIMEGITSPANNTMIWPRRNVCVCAPRFLCVCLRACMCTHSLTQGNLNRSVSQYSLLFLSETLEGLASQSGCDPDPSAFVLQKVKGKWIVELASTQHPGIRSSSGTKRFEEISHQNRNELQCKKLPFASQHSFSYLISFPSFYVGDLSEKPESVDLCPLHVIYL